MYNYCEDKFLGSNIFSSHSFLLKRVNPYLKSGFEANLKKLPAIKEEDGSSSEEESEITTKSVDDISSYSSFPSVNINCLMNVNIKQSHSIWNTNFGKRLIRENSVCEPDVKEIPYVKMRNKNSELPKPIVKTTVKVKYKKKTRKSGKKDMSQATKKKLKNPQIENLTKEESSSEVQSYTTITTENSEISQTTSSQESSTKSRPQFLAKFIKNIFENNSNDFKCEHCNERFFDIDELCDHEREHEMGKETCLLCEKVFYDAGKFAQHLLTHEGVDSYSCKKCMQYFPSLKKFKEHDEEVHQQPPPTVFISPPKLDLVKKFLPKFECKRCKLELDSAKSYEGHRRAHIRKDLAKAYLLSLNNTAF